ncbi:MAG: glutamate--tRNA ligase [Desulfurococcaceae archaeon]|uniref:Glutamate--tRNA ligase n=1 Tax=Staphylothermus marinus TaxID=2280 RepID=A0A7J3KGE6_STAMA
MSLDKSLLEKVRNVAYKHALLNAYKHGGKADLKAVISKIIAEIPESRGLIKDLIGVVKNIVDEVNKMSFEEQYRVLAENYPEALEEKIVEQERKLQPLPNATRGKVVTRFAPNPDYTIHLGNARPALLSYWYAREYEGRFILRFEDTDPRTKSPYPEAYEMIKNDLKWLGIDWDEEYIQSMRLPIFYSIVKELIQRGGAYVDKCSDKEFKKYRLLGKGCPHRSRSVDDNLEEFDKVISGYYSEGEVVIRIKTDMAHPDPSVRDWVGMRIIDTSKNPHPVVGSKYILWPTYNLACGIDDHLMGVTHVLRAREHLSNTVKQKYLYDHMGWKYPETIHFGRLSLEGVILSKSKMRDMVLKQGLKPYDDPRFGTLSGLRRRGVVRETIWEIVRQVGIKHIDARISFVNLASINRVRIDPISKRYMAVEEPLKIRFKLDNDVEAHVIRHPSTNEKFTYRFKAGEIELYVSSRDYDTIVKTGYFRLYGFANLKIIGETHHGLSKTLVCEVTGFSHEEAVFKKLPIIQWVKPDEAVEVELFTPKETKLVVSRLLGERALLERRVNDIVQLIRIGFARIDDVCGDSVKMIYAHD